MKCMVCGSKIPKGSHFCPLCGVFQPPTPSDMLSDEERLNLESKEFAEAFMRETGAITAPIDEFEGQTLNQVVVRPRARPPVVIPKLSPIEAAQLAQLLMDEGYLRYQRSPTVVHDIYGREYWGYYPRFRVAKTDLEDIEHFAKILGVTPRLYRGNWRIELAGDKLIEILKQIRPYMRGEKVPQADIIIEHGKFYIPNTTIPTPPTVLSLVQPERLMEYLKMKTPITPRIKGLSPTTQDIQTMRILRQQGLSISEIAEITGYSRPVIIKYLREE